MLYERPGTLDEALALMAGGPAWRVLAGGTDLYPATTHQSLHGPVLDIAGLAELRGIAREPSGWRIGAAATWTEVLGAGLPSAFSALVEAGRELGSIQIQNVATVMGNLCNASPAADGVPALMVLDAELELVSATGRRRLGLSEFILGNRRTARTPDEIAVAIHVPEAAVRGVSAFEKLGTRRYLVISIAMAAARVEVENGRIAAASLAVGACSEVARRLPMVERALVGQPADAPVIDAAAVAEALDPIDDVRATAAYRREAAAEILRRAVLRAAWGAS
ncbi:FAD binding domain-containing protein [Limibaculum sp. M0105]|uniref:FAD binding domain-containing protein n=1 Tax=Thermohalobaculum xanthum TaxID=2753746 RepID=A0A8J7M758_9RHOB|nr:FAD binding domain-containing protein [Thermohalobaculum xanthum]MBK0399599.1 FAD binding domain-containing protein [Thermohalobaculum xanthum]